MDEFRSVSFPYDPYLTCRGLLQTHYGLEHGEEIYELLKRTAQAAADSTGREVQPGLVFNDEGGEFVGMADEA